MPYKSLQQLRDEQKAHHERAMQFLREAAEIQRKIKEAVSIPEHTKLQQEWLEKDKLATAEIQKSIELINQYIQELERLKNRNWN